MSKGRGSNEVRAMRLALEAEDGMMNDLSKAVSAALDAVMPYAQVGTIGPLAELLDLAECLRVTEERQKKCDHVVGFTYEEDTKGVCAMRQSTFVLLHSCRRAEVTMVRLCVDCGSQLREVKP